MIIKILGGGCANCKKLEENTRKALSIAGVEATIEKVTEIDKIMSYGVMITPALVVDEVVKSAGKVISADEIVKFIK